MSQETAGGTPWSRSAASLLTAGWQIAEYKEKIELLEMDKELLSLEQDERTQALAARNAALEEEKEMLQHRLVSLTANGKKNEAQAKEMLQHAARQEADAQV